MGIPEWLGAGTCLGCDRPLGECRCGAVEGQVAPAAREKDDEIMKTTKATAAATKDEEAIDYVLGIEAKKLNEASIDAAIAKLGLKVGKKAGLPAKVEVLKTHFAKAKLPPGSVIGPCDNCGAGSSTHDFDACPFCGLGDDVPGAAAGGGEVAAEPEEPSSSRAIVSDKAVEVLAEVVSAGDLDSMVAEIRALNRGVASNLWIIAGKLVEIDKTEKWKERQTADGKVAYSKFEDFVHAELDMTRQYASALRRCFVNFQKEDFAQIGVSKLRLLLQFPDKTEQQEQLEKLRTGEIKGRRGIEDTKDKARERAGVSKKNKSKPSKATPTSTITIAQIEGSHKVKAYKKPDTKGEELKPAKQIADVPFGTFDMPNDVRLFIMVNRDAKGELFFKIEFKRVSPVA